MSKTLSARMAGRSRKRAPEPERPQIAESPPPQVPGTCGDGASYPAGSPRIPPRSRPS